MNQAPPLPACLRCGARGEILIRLHSVARYSGCYVEELRVTEETNSR
jgi:hypothetical protein